MKADLEEKEGMAPEEAEEGKAAPPSGEHAADARGQGEARPDPGAAEAGEPLGEDGIVLMDMVGDAEPEEGEGEPDVSGPQAPEGEPEAAEGARQDGIRWTGIATGEDVAVPEDVREERDGDEPESQAAEPGQADGITVLAGKMDRLLDEFVSKIKYDAHKESIITALHDELQQYRNDMVRKQLIPVVMDVIKVMDQVRKLSGHFRLKSVEEIGPEKILGALEAVPDDLEDVLSYQGISPFRYEDAVFNPVRQQVLRKVETPEPELDKTIAESVAPGYEWEGKVIRREMVNVYIHRPAAQEEAS